MKLRKFGRLSPTERSSILKSDPPTLPRFSDIIPVLLSRETFLRPYLLFPMFIGVGTAHAAAPKPIEACPAGTEVAFQCSVKGGKEVQLCASSDLTPETGTLQYRYGKPGQPELVFPKTTGQGSKDFLWSRYTRPMPLATTELALTFKNGDWTYSVYDNTHCEPDCTTSVGISLTNGTKTVDIPCAKKPATNNLFDLEGKVPQ